VTDTSASLKTRFAPSPSGDLHVGNIRTALYAWAFARGRGGTFLFRIEDTDASRTSDEHVEAAAEILRWLGLDWDEGVEVGGSAGPYRQSQRLDIYASWVERFLAEGTAYRCFCTAAELDERRKTAQAAGKPAGYDGRCRDLTDAQRSAFEAEGRTSVVRMRMPDGSTTFTDLIRGPVTFDHEHVPDFALTRGSLNSGAPLYTLAAPVDDVLMGITHVLRGEDLLSSTPRQIALYRAMGVAEADFPEFAHLPFVLGSDNVKLSKRNGEVSIAWYRRNGFLPEAMVNYLALLGWSPGDDLEFFGLDTLTSGFSLDRVGRNPARFDLAKLESLNGDHIRALPVDDLHTRILPFLAEAGLPTDAPVIPATVPLLQSRIRRLTDVPDLLRFLLVDEAVFELDEKDATKHLGEPSGAILAASLDALTTVEPWHHDDIQAALNAALVDGLGLKPRKAFVPLYVAVTGRAAALPLFESMVLLGRERTLARIAAAGPG
jgi:glutamyl-tRNA synthetase